jgi:putative flippase GtrA
VTINYSIQKFWVFKNLSNQKIYLQFSGFILSAILILFLNTFLMYIFVDFFGFWYILAQVFVSFCTASISYLLSKKLIFSCPKNKEQNLISYE